MTEVEQRLRERLRAAAPAFEPVPVGRIAGRVRRRRRWAGAAVAAGIAVLIGAAVTVPYVVARSGRPGVAAGGRPSVRSAPDRQPGPAAGACPTRDPGSMVDYVDFVRVGGREYLAGLPDRYLTVSRDALREKVAVVRCTLAAIQPGPRYQPEDGDASWLPAGTPVYGIAGYQLEARLAALGPDGRYRVYIAYPAPSTTR